MSLLPPPSAAKFRRSPPSATSSPAASTTGAASASASHISFPLNNVSSRSIQRRFAMAVAGKGPIEPHLPFSSLSPDSASLTASPDSASLTASVALPPSISLTRWNLDRRHIFVLNCTACVAAISASWLFFSAIPALLAFKRAAESLEKLLDVTAKELPDTMAAVRVSGMEISGLTMELSEMGQDITRGVRSSTRAIRIAEERLRHLTTMASIVPVQGKTAQKNETEEPVVARAARNLREGITKGRATFGVIFNVMQICWRAFNFLAARGRKRAV